VTGVWVGSCQSSPDGDEVVDDDGAPDVATPTDDGTEVTGPPQAAATTITAIAAAKGLRRMRGGGGDEAKIGFPAPGVGWST
jgi:hypothetical protein